MNAALPLRGVLCLVVMLIQAPDGLFLESLLKMFNSLELGVICKELFVTEVQSIDLLQSRGMCQLHFSVFVNI